MQCRWMRAAPALTAQGAVRMVVSTMSFSCDTRR
jgi:hypothetical protein